METHTVMRVATMMALLCTGMLLPSENVCAQAIDFSQIDKFESMGTATLHGASPPKTIVDDGEWHSVFVTIWQSDTEAKAYWKSLDVGQGCTHFKLLENSGLRSSATRAAVLRSDTCCLV